MPEMRKRTARATESMRLWPRLFLNTHRIRRGKERSFRPILEASDYRWSLVANDFIRDTNHESGVMTRYDARVISKPVVPRADHNQKGGLATAVIGRLESQTA